MHFQKIFLVLGEKGENIDLNPEPDPDQELIISEQDPDP